jgi:hypothetical protein
VDLINDDMPFTKVVSNVLEKWGGMAGYEHGEGTPSWQSRSECQSNRKAVVSMDDGSIGSI